MNKHLSKYVLFLSTVIIWSTVWIGIQYQIGVVSPEVSVFYRVVLTSISLVVACKILRHKISIPLNLQVFCLVLGVSFFSINYFLFYYSSRHLESGLVSVIFSSIVICNSINERIFFGKRISQSIIIGGFLGLIGMAMLFDISLTGIEDSNSISHGIIYAFLGTVLVSFGNISSSYLTKKGIGVLKSTTIGSLYGIAICSLYIAITKKPLVFDLSVQYTISLIYLSIVCSAIAYLLYLSLVKEIGTEKASFVTLLFPVFAMLISSIVESYTWTPASITGMFVLMIGLVIASEKTHLIYSYFLKSKHRIPFKTGK